MRRSTHEPDPSLEGPAAARPIENPENNSGVLPPGGGTSRGMERPPDRTRPAEHGRVQVKFFPGCLVLSIVLSVVGTILLNLMIRLFD